jgi:amino acid transporter
VKTLAELRGGKKIKTSMNEQQARAQLTVWWVLWAAFLVGICMVYQTLSVGAPQQPLEPGGSFTWCAALAPLAISILVRWFVLPGIRVAQTALVFFMIGIAMAESTCFMGIFIFPSHKQELFVGSVLGIFQFLPYYARRYFAEPS